MPERQGLIPLRERVRQLDRIYKVAEREIKEELLMVDAGNYQEVKAVKTQERIEKIIKMLNKVAIKWTKEAVPEAYEKGYDIATTRLEILGAKKNPEFPEKTHEQAIEREVDVTMDFLIKADQSIKLTVSMYLYLVRQASQGLMQIQEFDFTDEEFIDGLIGDALRAGETRGYAKKIIMEHIKSEVGEGKFIQIKGRNYNMKKYADLVAKTRLRVVQSEAVKNSCKEYDNDLIQISSHGTTCRSLICQEYEGNVYSISGQSLKYPMLPEWPPFHPRCQHHARPTSEAALDWRKSNA